MNNIDLTILGSKIFSDLLDELGLNNIIDNRVCLNNNKKILVKIIFPEKLKIEDVKKYLLKNEPIIIFLYNKDYINKNSIKLLNFQIVLQLPIDIFSFREILNILITKYNFFEKSKIIIKNYEIDSNQRSISKKNFKIKLTEKELELILVLNNNNGLSKLDLLRNIWRHNVNLDTHAFETHLHRLRKKIFKFFKDSNFIKEKNSLYYLVK